jgi:hypothetical protein
MQDLQEGRTAQEARETRLPLTRSLIAWWPRWRAADERGREHLRTLLSPSAVETLLRLEENVQAARAARTKGAVLSALLSGLVVPEPARVVSDLARAVYPESGEWDRDLCRYSALEAALREHLKAPREKPQPRAPGPVGKPTLPQEPARHWTGGNAMTIKPGRIEEMAQATAANGTGHHRGEGPAAVEPEPAPVPADPWPWSTRNLTARQEDVFEALRKRGLRPDCIVPSFRLREIARELNISFNAVSSHLSDVRKRLAITELGDIVPANWPRVAPDTPQPEPVAVELTPVSAELTPIAVKPPQEPQEPQGPVSAIVEHAAAEVARQEAAERGCAVPAVMDSGPAGDGERDSGPGLGVVEMCEILSGNATAALRARAQAEVLELRAQVAAQLRTIQAQARLNDRVRDENAALQDEVKRLTAAAVDSPAPAEEPFTEWQRSLAVRVFADLDPGMSVGQKRRVLALAADLAALAERR